VVVIDDGSTDDTRNVVAQFLAEPRVRYYVQNNKGASSAKNLGVLKSKGRYVAFLDADDMWVADKLESQMPLFSLSGAVGVVYSRLSYIDESGGQLRVADNELFHGRVSAPLLIRNFIGFGTTIVKRECFDRLGGFKDNLRLGGDYDLWLRFSTQYEFNYIDRPLLYYRLWAGQISNNTKARYLTGIETMKSFLRDFPEVVDKHTINEAWAHTYVGLGECVRDSDQSFEAAFRLYMRALCYKPGYLPAWKAMIKTILSSAKRRRHECS
jgi:glycosyltransferase involved in cell wall biosynthesis